MQSSDKFEKIGIWLISKALKEAAHFKKFNFETEDIVNYKTHNGDKIIVCYIFNNDMKGKTLKIESNTLKILKNNNKKEDSIFCINMTDNPQIFTLRHGIPNGNIDMKIEVCDYSSRDTDYLDWWKRISFVNDIEEVFKIGQEWYNNKRTLPTIITLLVSLKIDLIGLKTCSSDHQHHFIESICETKRLNKISKCIKMLNNVGFFDQDDKLKNEIENKIKLIKSEECKQNVFDERIITQFINNLVERYSKLI